MSRQTMDILLEELRLVENDMRDNWRGNAGGRLHIIYTQINAWSVDMSGKSLEEKAKNLTLLDTLWEQQ